MYEQPFISIIIPVYNAPQLLAECLTAIKQTTYHAYEIIVVDDASTDETLAVPQKWGASVFCLKTQSGPAAARNYGAKQAKGHILLFIDSDVLVRPDTLTRIAGDFSKYSDVAAVFGSYDDAPAKGNFLSQYKNLVHHFIHQNSKSEAVTFWAGCGAVRKDVFFAVGGFDAKKYNKPCIEDIELGYRMKKMGYRILLDKNLQVKHLKEWRLRSLLRADIFYRAIPWTQLILDSDEMVTDLNLQKSQKISAAIAGLSLTMLPIILYIPHLIYLIFFMLACILILNLKLFSFFMEKNGFIFTLLAFVMHLFYYLYSGLTFAFLWSVHKYSTELK